MEKDLSAKELARQLKKPEGEIGLKVAERMNINNREITKSVYQKIPLSPRKRILEIGYGNGKLLSLLFEFERDLIVHGIDISETMYKAAIEINKSLVEKKKNMDLRIGDVTRIPFPNDTFDFVCTINTIYFWDNPLKGFQEIYRVLRPNGRFYINLTRKEDLMKLDASVHGIHLYEESELSNLTRSSGLEMINQWMFDEKLEVNGSLQNFCSIIFEFVKPTKQKK